MRIRSGRSTPVRHQLSGLDVEQRRADHCSVTGCHGFRPPAPRGIGRRVAHRRPSARRTLTTRRTPEARRRSHPGPTFDGTVRTVEPPSAERTGSVDRRGASCRRPGSRQPAASGVAERRRVGTTGRCVVGDHDDEDGRTKQLPRTADPPTPHPTSVARPSEAIGRTPAASSGYANTSSAKRRRGDTNAAAVRASAFTWSGPRGRVTAMHRPTHRRSPVANSTAV